MCTFEIIRGKACSNKNFTILNTPPENDNSLGADWSSNSGYSLLGGLCALAQTISYEVRLAFILLSFVVLVCRYNLAYFYFFQIYF